MTQIGDPLLYLLAGDMKKENEKKKFWYPVPRTFFFSLKKKEVSCVVTHGAM